MPSEDQSIFKVKKIENIVGQELQLMDSNSLVSIKKSPLSAETENILEVLPHPPKAKDVVLLLR